MGARVRGLVIPNVSLPGVAPALLSLVFLPGRRPNADDIVDLASRDGKFAVSHRPTGEAGWVELLFNGLTFDVTGLAPGPPAAAPPVAHRYGVVEPPAAAGEPVTLAPGPHLAAGRTMLPVVRGALALTVCLTGLSALGAVCWHPARSAVAPDHFARTVSGWLDGGAFPALGLTSLYLAADGWMCTEGLRFFTGQELCLEPGEGTAADDAKLAVRLIDRLVVHGRITEPVTWTFAERSLEVRLEPAPGDIVRAWRQTV